MEMHPLGTMRIFPRVNFRYDGPLATRSLTDFERVDWSTGLWGDVTMQSGMGCYLDGPGGAKIDGRIAFTTASGIPFLFQYISVGDMDTHITGETPIFLAGQLEVDCADANLSWLNHVQIVGEGMLTLEPLCQEYKMAYVANRRLF